MNVGKAIYYLLANNASVSAITTRIYPEVAPQDAAAPYIVYTVSNVTPDDTHDGPAEIDEVRMEIMCVDDSYDVAADLAMAARVALDRVYGTYNSVNIESIQFTDASIEVRDIPRQYGQDLTFIVRIKRDDVQIATGSPIEDLTLDRLSDVDDDIVDALDRQALVYDEATSEWIADGVGQVVIPVRNPSRDDSIAIGTVLKATGAQGDRILVAPFEPDTDDMKYLIGIASEALGAGDDGHAQVYGELRMIDTDAYEVGDVLYAAAGGTLSTTENQYPICIVTRKQQNTGRLFLRLWTPGKGYHQRYRTEALAEMFVGVGAEVELYYTATADGDGYVTQDLTAAVGDGNVEERVLRYKSGAFGDTVVLGYTDAGLATDATYAEMLTAFGELLKTEGAPITIYATRTEVSARSSLLNDYGGAAAAYSLRELDTNYTGSAIRVRRASDDAEQDIGFDGNGDLDTTALATFCLGTDGFVKVWYDQAGANDATQTTTGSQPKIYDSSTGVVTENGKPAVDFDGVDDKLTGPSGLDYSTMFAAAVYSNLSNGDMILGAQSTNSDGWRLHGRADARFRVASTNVDITGVSNLTNQFLQVATIVSGTGTNYLNSSNSASASVTIGTTTAFNLNLAHQITGFVYSACKMQEVLVYVSDQSANRTGIESNINDYFGIYTPFTTGLLDDYGGAAAAYSLRRLSSTYTGDAIRVRRASDNAEQDIGFDIEGNLNTSALASFCSGTDGFVRIWYDQANSNDAEQTTTGNQPKIYDSTGGVIEEGSAGNEKPALQFDGSNDAMPTGQDIRAFTNFAVATADDNSQNVIFGSATDTNEFFRTEADAARIQNNAGITVAAVTTNQNLIYAVNDTTSQIGVNGGAVATGATQNDDFTALTIGVKAGAFYYFGRIQEIVIYGTNQSTNRSGIETDINDYYNIYTP